MLVQLLTIIPTLHPYTRTHDLHAPIQPLNPAPTGTCARTTFFTTQSSNFPTLHPHAHTHDLHVLIRFFDHAFQHACIPPLPRTHANVKSYIPTRTHASPPPPFYSCITAFLHQAHLGALMHTDTFAQTEAIPCTTGAFFPPPNFERDHTSSHFGLHSPALTASHCPLFSVSISQKKLTFHCITLSPVLIEHLTKKSKFSYYRFGNHALCTHTPHTPLPFSVHLLHPPPSFPARL